MLGCGVVDVIVIPLQIEDGIDEDGIDEDGIDKDRMTEFEIRSTSVPCI